MRLGTSIIIFFLAIIALVAEFVLYMIFGIGAAFSGDISNLSGTVFFFVGLMMMTGVIGVLAPICAVIEMIVKKTVAIDKIKKKKQHKFVEIFLNDIGSSLLVIFSILILIFVIVFGSVGKGAIDKELTKSDDGINAPQIYPDLVPPVTQDTEPTKPRQPIKLTGFGQEATDNFYLEMGLYRFKMNHDGDSNFAIWLYSANGDRLELLVNEIGPFEGSRAFTIPRSGEYLLDVSADASWEVTIE